MTHVHPAVARVSPRARPVSGALARVVVRLAADEPAQVRLRERPRPGGASGWTLAVLRARVLRWRVGLPVAFVRWGRAVPGGAARLSRKAAARQLVLRVAGADPGRQFVVEGLRVASAGGALPANVAVAGAGLVKSEVPVRPAGSTTPAAAGARTALNPQTALALVIFTALVSIGIDQWTKQLILDHRPHGVSILGGLFYLDLTFNSGAAFSFGRHYTWVFPIIALAVTGVILWFARTVRSRPWAVALGLIAGGAIGNLLDRLFRSPGPFRGNVVDFISIFAPNGQYFPIWNMADTSLTVGVLLAILLEFTGRRRDGSRATKDDAKGDA